MEKTLNLILEKLDSMDLEIKTINHRLEKLEQGQAKLEQGQAKLEQGQQEIKDHLTQLDIKNADRHRNINHKIDNLSKDLSSVEIITSKNWNDIALLKAVK
ncbi:hypothetical protein [Marinisporobacter balticus]|uniref:Uncharacterized protein n=1 Tax=Marinisporobacter balticus TaxID=2018667 RepID=A0A4R2KXL3_9FIRM|nr:hypothetical protein [Marinisporobacter balticus]TCO78764.1 hypothetical protein EV214_104151 [Marinisporobacter balticus]